MMDSTSEVESDASSADGVATNEQLKRRVQSLQQENRVLKTEVDTLKLKIRGLNEMNQQLRQNSVNIQAKAEQEEEYISNTLLKKITELKKEKESLALNYEQEEECLTNELNRKFTQLRQEKVALEQTLAREQEDQVTKLKMRIEKLETDMNNKQNCLDKLRREKIELENALEQEQEALVNRLWKKMEKLEHEKRTLQEKLESLGALLSASSSNQSLASVPPLSTSGNGSTQGGAGGLLSQTAPQRPISSGPGSLRGSLRHHPPHGSSVSSGVNPGLINPGSTSAASGLQSQSPGQSPGRPLPPPLSVSITSSGDPRSGSHLQHGQLNQSASLSGELLMVKTPDATNIAPPQSPMDVDFADSGAGATCGSLNQPHSQNHKPLSTPMAVTKTEAPNSAVSGNGAPNWDSHITAVYVNRLRDEVCHLRQLLAMHEAENASKMPMYESEERSAIEENRRLRKMLQMEKERREALSRQLSESESSLEMEDERRSHGHTPRSAGSGGRCSCCSPSSSPGKPCAIHQVPLPNSPATPTTSSSGAPAFVKPANRVSLSGMPDRASSSSHPNDPSYSVKRLSSASYSSSNEQLLFGDMDTHSSLHDGGGSVGRRNVNVDDDDDDDEDDDARCATPPVCQPDSTK
ncbi:unnamed protein product [Echinostoma caproni]|uniref:Coiled-coil domain-containing protein 6 n=1 Tax=Echinostoma caproni TaxID=27848 RepID=A0A183APA9_9TREM|nr:unnamed protein product [Echinostoma caproni]